jgi:hypothetical protein
LLLLFAAALSAQDQKLSVTVFDEKTGAPEKGLTAANFAVRDGSTNLRIEAAAYKEELLDLMLIVDASMIGEAIRPLATPVIDGLGDGEQMAVISFDQSATLLQDFTSSKDFLHQAITQLRYGNNPRILDALYAGLDGGFANSTARRAALVLAAGAEGQSHSSLADILELARRRNASIFVAFAEGYDSGLLEKLAGGSGGAWFNAKKLDLKPQQLAKRIYSVVRGRYELTVSGVFTLGDRVQVEVTGLPKSKKKLVATALPIE